MAQIAQLVERRTRHPEVVGSNPTLGEVFELRPLTQKTSRNYHLSSFLK